MSSEVEYVVFDRLSMNQLGEFATFEEAEECFFRFVVADPTSAEHILIWRDDGTDMEQVDVDPEKIRRLTAA